MLNGFAYCRMIFENGGPQDFTYLAVNRAFSDLTGLHDVEGKNASEVIPGIREADPRLFEIYGRVASTGIPERFEMFMKSRDDWFSVSVYSPKEGYFVSVFDVITERRLVDEVIRESEQKYRTLFESMATGVFYQVADGTLEDVNPSALRMLGLTREQFLGRDSYDPRWEVVAEDGTRLTAEQHPSLTALRTGKAVTNRIFGVYNPAREDYSWLNINAEPQFRPGEPAPFMVYVTMDDITERRRAEVALRESGQKFRETVKSLQEGYYSTTLDGVLLEHNVAFNRILGTGIDGDLTGSHLPDFWQNPEQRREYVNELLARGFVHSYLINAKKATGENIWVLANARLVRDSAGMALRVEGTFTNITDLKRAQDALKASEEKFSTAFRTSPYAITITRARDGQFIEVNDAFSSITGYTREETQERSSVGLNLWVDPDDRNRVMSALREGRGVEGQEFRFRKKNGEIMTGLFTARMIPVDNEPCILSSIEDITERRHTEEELRKSEEKFRNVFDWANDAIMLHSLTVPGSPGRFIDVNRVACRMLRYARDELLTRGPPDIVPRELHHQLAEIIRQADTEDSVIFETRFLRKDGTTFPVEPSGRLVSYEGQKIWVSHVRDITDRKRAESRMAAAVGALQESKARLSLTLEVGNAGTWEWDLETNEVWFDDRFHAMLGYAPGELPSTAEEWKTYHHPEDLPVMLSRAEAYLRGDIAIYESEHRIRARIGSWAWIFTRGQLTDPPITGPRKKFIGIAMNVTDRKRTEEALIESEEKFRLVVESAPEAIFIQTEGRFAYVNPAASRLFGAETPDQLVGRTVLDQFHPDFREVVAGRIRRLNEERQPVEKIEEMILRLDGTPVSVEISAVPVVYTGRNGALVFVLDVTGRKQSELQRESLINELEGKNAELERFTYTVSHDLKSPLITIRGFIGLLRDDAEKGDTVQMGRDINRISSATDKMQALLSDLLALSRIGRVTNPPERVNFGVLAEEARELLAGIIQEQGVLVTIAPALPDVVVDRTRIREVLTNLIENAIKFRGSREPRVEIGVVDTDGQPAFYVRDNGIGIEPECQSRIFGLFEKLDPKSGGTGIGLAIVRRIIEVHGGKIWVESAGPGQGSTFLFTLPLTGGTKS
jgi:PAS domain S-box-containing protein